MTRALKTVAGLLASTVLLAVNAQAQVTWYVDDDNCPGPGSGTEGNPYCSIQTAIDNAVDTDEIVVAPGTYYEMIDFLGKAITLRSSAGPDVTAIDGGGAGSVVTCESDETPDTVLEGFTITGGFGLGGGMEISHSSPTVSYCTFIGNTRGGMYNHSYSDPAVANCRFSGNTASHGAGMYNSFSDPTVTSCTVSGNTATFHGGGGMYNLYCSPTVINCTFTDNSGLHGGGMHNNNSRPTVIGCVFDGNTADEVGGGMVNGASFSTVINCTFTGNVGRLGGGMANSAYDVAVVNCKFVENTGVWGGAIYNDYTSNPTITNSILWDNLPEQILDDSSLTTVRYSDIQDGVPGPGNIDVHPLFVDIPNGDFRLRPGSPCIDAGNNNAITGFTDTDLDGNPRFADDPAKADTGCGLPVVVDIGAYEYQGDPATVILADLDSDGVVRIADLLILTGCLGSDDPDCCTADLDLDGMVGMGDRWLLLGKLIQSIPDP